MRRFGSKLKRGEMYLVDCCRQRKKYTAPSTGMQNWGSRITPEANHVRVVFTPFFISSLRGKKEKLGVNLSIHVVFLSEWRCLHHPHQARALFVMDGFFL